MNLKRFMRKSAYIEAHRLKVTKQWKDYMPEQTQEFITTDPIYNKLKHTYHTKGPRVWLVKVLHQHGPMTSREIWDRYELDREASEQNFFNSLSDLKKKYIHFLLREGTIRVHPFEPKLEAFRGYSLNTKKGFEKIDPHIVMAMENPPKTSIVNRYMTMAQQGIATQYSAEQDPNEIQIG